MAVVHLRRLVPAGLILLAGCTAPRLDQPSKVRHTDVPLYGLFDSSSSADGTSWQWSALLWLVGQDVEGTRRHARALPVWWHDEDPPYSEDTLVFPFYYGRTTTASRWRFYSLLYGFTDSPEERSDYALLPFFHWSRSKHEDVWDSGFLFVYDWDHRDARNDLTLVPILGLAHLARFQWGFPAEGEAVPALGRDASRRFELLNLFGFVTLFGYDDVGDRREIRVLTLLSDEVLSPIRSWRGRGDDPFVREWVFPLYMDVADADGGFFYVGPLWGGWHDTAEESNTDWWLAGLLARTHTPEGTTWRVLGLPVSSP